MSPLRAGSKSRLPALHWKKEHFARELTGYTEYAKKVRSG